MNNRNPTARDAAADRFAIRELVDGWAHFADRRLPRQQAELFVPDGAVAVYLGDPETSEPTQQIRGRDALMESFGVLNDYQHTTHFNGQSVIALDGDIATGESYCLAHHVWTQDDTRSLMVMSIRYLDHFRRTDAGWLFVERKLVVDWTETRILQT